MNLAGLPYAVESMRLADVATVARLEQDIFTMAWPESSFRFEVTQNKASEYLVLRHLSQSLPRSGIHPFHRKRLFFQESSYDESILGYAGIWMILDEGHICTLAIRQDWRGRGLGELMLVSLLESACHHDMDAVTLEVRVSNRAAQALYRKYGFEQVGIRRRYYIDNGEDALLMTVPAIQSPVFVRQFERLVAHLRQRLVSETERGRLVRPDRPDVE